MAQRPKAKPKRKGLKNTDKKQSARFIEIAQMVGIEDDSNFERVLKKIVAPKLKTK